MILRRKVKLFQLSGYLFRICLVAHQQKDTLETTHKISVIKCLFHEGHCVRVGIALAGLLSWLEHYPDAPGLQVLSWLGHI